MSYMKSYLNSMLDSNKQSKIQENFVVDSAQNQTLSNIKIQIGTLQSQVSVSDSNSQMKQSQHEILLNLLQQIDNLNIQQDSMYQENERLVTENAQLKQKVVLLQQVEEKLNKLDEEYKADLQVQQLQLSACQTNNIVQIAAQIPAQPINNTVTNKEVLADFTLDELRGQIQKVLEDNQSLISVNNQLTRSITLMSKQMLDLNEQLKLLKLDNQKLKVEIAHSTGVVDGNFVENPLNKMGYQLQLIGSKTQTEERKQNDWLKLQLQEKESQNKQLTQKLKSITTTQQNDRKINDILK